MFVAEYKIAMDENDRLCDLTMMRPTDWCFLCGKQLIKNLVMWDDAALPPETELALRDSIAMLRRLRNQFGVAVSVPRSPAEMVDDDDAA